MRALLMALPLALLLASCGPREKPQTAAPPSKSMPPAWAAKSPASELKGELRVGVPCGIALAYEEAKKAFVAEHPGVTFKDEVLNIEPLTRAVRDGKIELDIYLGLGERETHSVIDKGLAAGEPTAFLRQTLSLVVASGNPLGIRAIEDLADPKVKTVALCGDDLAIGQAGEKALRASGVWEKLEADKRLIRTQTPQQSKELVFGGKADATFVFGACTDESWNSADPDRAVQGKAEVILTVPDEVFGGMHAQAVVLKTARDAALAEAFVKSLLDPEIQKAVTKWGYAPAVESSPNQ